MLLKGLFHKPLLLGEMGETTFRVLPIDTEFMAMNAGRYFNFMELSQQNCNQRAGFLKLAIKHGWWVVVRSQCMSYYKPIMIMQQFEVRSQVIGWDERHFYWETRFFKGNQLCSVGWSKVMVRSKRGGIDSASVLSQMNLDPAMKPVSSEILTRLESPKRSN